MTPHWVHGFTDIGCALLFILLSVPLVYRKIPMNRWYGFRLRKSFQSDECWFSINEYGGRQLILWSLPLIVTGAIKIFLPMDGLEDSVAAILGAGPLVVCMGIAIVRTLIFAKKLQVVSGRIERSCGKSA
ncbi:MAG TPA: SdpI family protein [Candidatus Hydrogenedentes bacterium]|nr:SdpI family protein [Candidatus Hydrogenedentota bacterium]HOT49504.1 SdpI family protein [Candidatus Hydrogenedentota bacterium]HOV74330.1 SdpI family protein [Candidatus Hydrogenedentota bacterium]HPC14977.1 SdpI family protein [Candidatus Hydrogenedentota bacterium]HRT19162.1 SdpI family protein [Candidatus Hydrogenedentota bacterium]